MIGSLTAGALSDRYGRRPWMIWPMLIQALAVLPAFWLLVAYRTGVVLYAISFSLGIIRSMGGTAAFITITESLPVRARSGALSVIYAVAVTIFGGSTQFVIAWLTGVTGNPLAPAWYMFAAAALGFVAVLFAKESAPDKAKPATV